MVCWANPAKRRDKLGYCSHLALVSPNKSLLLKECYVQKSIDAEQPGIKDCGVVV